MERDREVTPDPKSRWPREPATALDAHTIVLVDLLMPSNISTHQERLRLRNALLAFARAAYTAGVEDG